MLKTEIYIETGSKRVFASALDWPGWSRSGRDEASAVQALLDYGGRYASAIHFAKLDFDPPVDGGSFKIVERVKGDATTDFGSPGSIPKADWATTDDTEVHRLQTILKACWRTFDRVVEKAEGKQLRSGPRGGGRDRDKIYEHVLGAEHAYGRSLGVNLITPEPANLAEFRQGLLQAVVYSAHGELPKHGPRGGLRWPARYFVRRTAWHVLDHAWEIEDRLEAG